jgi:hypothetical protein
VIEVLGTDSVLGSTCFFHAGKAVTLEILDGPVQTLPIEVAATREDRQENREMPNAH